MVEYIAEASSNHNRNLERALAMIDCAKYIRATGIKFQLFKIDQLFVPIALEKRPYLADRVHWELPVTYIPPLSDYAHSLGLTFSCTPFYMQAIDELYPYVDSYKVASYQVLWLDFLRKLANTGKPIAISFGMASNDEIDAALEALDSCNNLTILHCTSVYPTPLSECNLARMDAYHAYYPKCKVGWSDHSCQPITIYSAVLRHYAQMLEFHLDIDGTGEEYHLGHCWLPREIKPVLECLHDAEMVDGSADILATDELAERLWRTDPSDGLRPTIAMREMLRDA